MKFHIFPLAAALLAINACSDSAGLPGDAADSPREMSFTFAHPSERARVTATGFEKDDCVGLYVTEAGALLESAGGLVGNEPMTFDGSAWKGSRQLYWNAGSYDAYAYYPFVKDISVVTDHPFAVQTDQSTAEGYTLSDLLCASSTGVSASTDPILMTFRHVLSRLTIRLVKGEDYEGEIPEDVKVYVHSTVPQATVDIQAGMATVDGHSSAATIRARKENTTLYSAIIVPQRLSTRVPLIEVISEGVSYMYDTKFLFKPGINHLVNLVIDKNPDQLKIEIGGEITDWTPATN